MSEFQGRFLLCGKEKHELELGFKALFQSSSKKGHNVSVKKSCC